MREKWGVKSTPKSLQDYSLETREVNDLTRIELGITVNSPNSYTSPQSLHTKTVIFARIMQLLLVTVLLG